MNKSWLTLGAVPALLYGLIALPFALYWGDLPDPMATHWGLSGNANGSLPAAVMLLLMVGIFAAAHLAVMRVVARSPHETPSFIAGLYGIGTLLVGVTWQAVLANRDQATWQDADGVGLIQIVLVLVVAGLAGSAGWLLAGGRSVSTPEPNVTVPTLDVADPGSTIWSSQGIGHVFYWIGAALIVAGLATWGWSTLVLIGLGLGILVFAKVRVTVSRRGAVVSLGWMGYPSWTVPLNSITEAQLETVAPMAYGGWGYRARPGVRAVVTRGGEALRLVRTDGADFVITVDDAKTGAGLINSMLAVDSS